MKTEILYTKRLTLKPVSEGDTALLFPLLKKESIEDYCYKRDTMGNWILY